MFLKKFSVTNFKNFKDTLRLIFPTSRIITIANSVFQTD